MFQTILPLGCFTMRSRTHQPFLHQAGVWKLCSQDPKVYSLGCMKVFTQKNMLKLESEIHFLGWQAAIFQKAQDLSYRSFCARVTESCVGQFFLTIFLLVTLF